MKLLCVLFAVAHCSCAQGSSPSAASAPISPSVAARWDGGVITTDEVRLAAQRLPTALREQFQTDNGQREFVQALLAKRLLHDEARRRGFTQTAEVKEQLRELEERLAIQALLEDATKAKGPPREDELKAYFEAHRSEFRTPVRVRVARLLVRGRPEDKALKQRAEALRARVVAKKEPMSKLAALGEGPEAATGGDVGWVTEASDEETTAALALKTGEASPVVRTPSGLAVLVATQREEAREATYDETRQAILNRYGPVQQRKVFDELVQRLKTQAQVQVNPAAFP
ncbi:MAG: peptidyl-prolyl cis-trans isomerase [Myxococcaceae bacterium]|nr:peptidyl-prolyl cis-trans isomerase [Myxococcaceae bacterium]